MRLTQIKLAGFKSFTDPTTIHLPGQLVAVIGPNGCGKSNVIDAVRWVLGESSAKQLRGESMQDIIFNGAATRRPAPRASVELVFDNSDHSLQGAWGQYTEISIKRQLTRQGESSYYINNQPVRRLDITNLFLGTGVGTKGYAVIEQGMISRIIEARPEELRAYIEEAAGVSKYKARRKDTETRLKDTREHLQRLSDLQTELTRQIEKLEKQANTAEHYQQLQQDHHHTQNTLNYLQWQHALTQADQAEQNKNHAKNQQQTANQSHQELNQQIQHIREQEQNQQQHIYHLNQEYALLREQIARLEEKLRASQQQQQRLERERATAQAQLQKINQEQTQLQQESTLLTQQISEQETLLSEQALIVAEHEIQLPELEQLWQNNQTAQHNQQEELNRIKRELALKQQQLQHLSNTLEHSHTRIQQLHQEQTNLNLPTETELHHAQQEAELQQQRQEQIEQTLINSEQQRQTIKQQIQTAEQHYQQHQHEYLNLHAQQQALAELLNNQQHDFWANTPHAQAPTLWQHIHIHPEWQHALSVILANRLQARMLPEINLPLNDLPTGEAVWINQATNPTQKTQPTQALIHQIKAEKSFQAALNYWLDGVLCAPNLSYALAHQNELKAQQIWLTPEGHQIDLLSVALFNPQQGSQLISQKNRHDQLLEQLNTIQPILQTAEQTRQHLYQSQQQAEQHHQTIIAQQRQQQTQLHTANNQLNELLTKTNQGQLRQQHIQQELQQLKQQQQHTQQQYHRLEQDIEILNLSIDTLNEAHQNISQQTQQQQQQLQHTRKAYFEANRQHGLAEIELNKQQQRLKNIQQQIATLEQQKLNWQERQTELALNTEQNTNQEQHQQLEELSEQALTLQEHIQQAQSQLQHTQNQGRTLFEQQQNLANELPKFQAAVQTALLQQQEALINAKHFHDNLIEHNADIDQLAQQLSHTPQHITQLNKQLNSLNQQIQALGAVNLAALEELKETQQRQDYYHNQSQDVQAAIDLLEEAINQIDNETKQRFKETFDAVNNKVHNFFPTLFGGGEAHLTMIGDDLLTAGVSIMARPPGKKNSTIHLLSGGEKALTAMSLVFALFSLTPAPFCLLDEVDAPLDDANTSRFCDLVKEMSAQTQFLYISHNRLTMEMAEQLIGVTMQEKGVSRIVSVDIQQALKLAKDTPNINY